MLLWWLVGRKILPTTRKILPTMRRKVRDGWDRSCELKSAISASYQYLRVFFSLADFADFRRFFMQGLFRYLENYFFLRESGLSASYQYLRVFFSLTDFADFHRFFIHNIYGVWQYKFSLHLHHQSHKPISARTTNS